MSTDHEWERWGASDPYYSVLTNPKFRSAAMTPESREEFFHSGGCHVDYVLDTCRRHIDPSFSPRRVLDFGCGVGRLVIPFARQADAVVGMDISPSMLAEARRNCDEQGAQNVELVVSDDMLSSASGSFNLVHSCIVLQHIEVPRGRALFMRLIDRIEPGGIGALHVTFAWDIFTESYGQPPAAVSTPAPPTSALARAKAQLRSLLGSQRLPQQPPSTDPPSDPEMQMNYYNLNELMYTVQRVGSQQVHVAFTDHGGALGVFLFFRKPESPR